MAQELWSLKEDGYLNVDLASQNIVYHPALNIILVTTRNGIVHVLDVNSGFILQTSSLSAKPNSNIRCRYLEDQNKILFIDGQGIGVRSDYNGVLLLDTILQRRLKSSDDIVKLELLLSEAIMFQQSLKSIDLTCTDLHSEVLTQITEKITRAQSQPRSGIKAQKWNTVCLELKLSTLRAVALRVVSELKRQSRHIPALAVAAGISDRLSELAPRERVSSCDRSAMYSEAKRRETFARWPHMDYKWALPEQMAQAGFYHQPNSSGDDRAMCFTCAVCLVCWERTDEPWSEHERHSPSCPFVKGEYTQNVPLSVTYATSPALDITPRGYIGNIIVSHTNVEDLIAFGHSGGMVSVYNIAGKLKRTHCFYVTQDSGINESAQNVLKRDNIVTLTSLCLVAERKRISTPQHKTSSNAKSDSTIQNVGQIRPSIICGVTVTTNANSKVDTNDSSPSVKALNDHNQQKNELASNYTIEQQFHDNLLVKKYLYLVVYDFQYKSAACSTVDENVGNVDATKNVPDKSENLVRKCDILMTKLYNIDGGEDDEENQIGTTLKETNEIPTIDDSTTKKPIEPFVVCNDLSPKSYQNLIPHDNNSIFIPPDIKSEDATHNGPRVCSQDTTLIDNTFYKDMDYSFTNGQLDDSDRTEEYIEPSTSTEKSISDHIAEMKSKGEAKAITYSHAVQCIKLPDYCQNKNLEIFEIIPTRNGKHILVVLRQKDMAILGKSILLIYSLNFSYRVVKIDAKPILSKELSASEQPEEITLLPLFDGVENNDSLEGLAALVCADGALRLIDLVTLNIVSEAKTEGSRYVSLTYCNSLERLCVSTETGPLHFYAIMGRDNDFIEEKDEEELSTGSPMRPDSGGSQLINTFIPSLDSSFAQTFHTDKMDDEALLITASKNGDISTFSEMLNCRSSLTVKELKLLHFFCQFEPISATYCAVLPACWSEMQQCQRKSTQHMQGTNDSNVQHTRTWRLQTDATTWDEHVVELALPWSACIGHVDLSFSLHTPCPSLPNIQVTLLKQHASGIGHRSKFLNTHSPSSSAVDNTVQFLHDTNQKNTAHNESASNISMENPVLTDEYLRAHNVDILAGPVSLSSCLDLSEQGGTVTLTSPKLLKARGRTLLIHIKALLDPAKDITSGRKEEKMGSSAKKSRSTMDLSSFGTGCYVTANNSSTVNSLVRSIINERQSIGKKSESYIGCDWLHEISFAIRTMKQTNLPNERQQRTAMLESNHLITILCECACRSGKDRSRLVQALSLDILTWIATVRLGRHKSELGLSLLHAIEPHLYGLILAGLIEGTRSIAHKMTKLLIVCIENGRNMLSSSSSQQFDNAVLQALLRTSSALGRVQSASGLRWFAMLLQHVASNAPNGTLGAAAECLALIRRTSQQLNTRTNPYHQLLRSRFGLYATPFDPELLDIDPPVFHKSSSFPVTFASVVTGDSFQQASNNNGPVYQTNPTPDNFDLKDLFTIPGISNNNPSIQEKTVNSMVRCRGLITNNYLKGLLETEPLYYTCSSASEGTRIEKVESGSIPYNSAVINYCDANDLVEKLEQGATLNETDLLAFFKTQLPKDKVLSSTIKDLKNGANNNNNAVVDALDSAVSSDNSESCEQFVIDDITNMDSARTDHVQPFKINSQQKAKTESSDVKKETNSKKTDQNTIAWQQLLLTPPQQILVIERMNSGARRFVVLDFGAPILLTDLLIPPCNDLVSLSIDVWWQGEDIDCVRLAVSTDIGSKCLILSDLQPPPLCRYLKITTIGRYGMSTTRCKIPVGNFYGHVVILPEDVYPYNNVDNVVPNKEQIEAQNNILITLLEDINCRYTLSCSKLRDLLAPFLLNDDPNTQHMYNYLKNTKSEKKTVENAKILTAYQECVNYQHQLNIVRNIIKRLGSYLDQEEVIIYESEANCLAQASTDKLIAICENMLEVLLCIVYEIDSMPRISPSLFKYFNESICEELFMSLCVDHDMKLQLSAASLLVRMCGLQPWWGNFLANTLSKLFSSQNRNIFPQDRVFIILAYLCRKSLSNGANRSCILDPMLRSLCALLKPLLGSQGLLVAAKTDLGLIGWQLLYLSLSLDSIKFEIEENNTSFNSRWDWLTAEASINRVPPNQVRINDGYRKKLHKRFLHYKQQLDNLDYTQKAVQVSTQALSAMSNHAANLSSKLEAALKQQEHFFKKIKQYSNKPIEDTNVTRCKQYLEHKKIVNNTLRLTENVNQQDPLAKTLNYEHCLTVCRGLILLILNLDCSCNIDIFLLSCKTIARLIIATKPTLTLQQLVTPQQLVQLLRLAIRNEGSQWISHAISCLLQDMLESQKIAKNTSPDISTQEEDPFGVTTEINTDDQNQQNSGSSSSNNNTAWITVSETIVPAVLDIEEDFMALETQITNINQNNNIKANSVPLPSLPESDDSDTDDVLDVTITKKFDHKFGLIPVSSVSTATDARLEIGLDNQPEIALRRLTMLGSYHLPAAIHGLLALPPDYMKGRFCDTWPENLVTPWLSISTSDLGSVAILTKCFDTLISDLQYTMSVATLEQVLQLWITMSSFLSENSGNKNVLNPSTIPSLTISTTSISQLISTMTTLPSVSLRAWTLTFQCLTLASNLPIRHEWNSGNDLEQSLNGLASYIIKDPQFAQMLFRFFSGNGITLFWKKLAGPMVSQTLHDLLVRLQIRADVVTISSRLGNQFKNILLKLLLQMIEIGTGPIALQQGPLDVQCEFVQTLLHLDFKNSDLTVIINILKNLGILVHNYMSRNECVKNIGMAEQRSGQGHNFGNLFSSVLGTNTNKHGKPASYDNLVISLLKLGTKLAQIPLPNNESSAQDVSEITEINSYAEIPIPPTCTARPESENISQTDESKAEQRCQNQAAINGTPISPIKVPCIADNLLQDVSTILRFCHTLNLCTDSSLAMLVGAVPNHGITEIGEPTSVGDALFQLMSAISKKCTKMELLLRSILEFLSLSDRNASVQGGSPHLSEPLVWWLLQVLSTEVILQEFTKQGGVHLVAKHLVQCYKSAISNLQPGTISQIMQYLSSGNGAQASSLAYQGGTVNSKKMQQASLEQNEGLINFAPLGVISSTSPTAQSADVLIQATIAPHRRARTPQWSYHFYPDENHVELHIALPAAILLREVQLQPHLSSLATCPSAIAIEVSRNGSAGLVPVCPPLPTSGMSFIRMHLPTPEVVTSVLIRLYKPRDSTNIGLLQIRLLGTPAFGGINKTSSSDLVDDELLSKSSLGWLRLLHQCFNLPAADSELSTAVVQEAAQVDNLLETCCGLLLVPTQVPPLFIGGTTNLERVLLKLSLHDSDLGFRAIKMLLDNSSAFLQMTTSCVYPTRAVETVCELLYKLCTIKDQNTGHRVAAVLTWLKASADRALSNYSDLPSNASYIHCIASILWSAHHSDSNLTYDLKSLVTKDLFEAIYKWTTITTNSLALKKALDALLCSFCVINESFFYLLLFRMSVLVPNLSTDRCASVSDDQKDSEGMTDEKKQNIGVWDSESNWYNQLVLKDLSTLVLTGSQLSTIATASSSIVAVRQLLDSGLPKLLTHIVFQFCTVCSDILKSVYSIDRKLEELVEEAFREYPIMRLENIVNILNFFSDMCFEVSMREWLGSTIGSVFWIPLLRLLCHDRSASQNRSMLCSGNYYKLEDATIRFLTKCCSLCPTNQTLLAACLCDVIEYQKVTPAGISGFTRRLILQLLLENEKVWVSIKADETIYKNVNTTNTIDFGPHPAYRVTNNHILLHLDTNITLGEIFDNYISFTFGSTCLGPDNQKENLSAVKDLKKDMWEVALDMTDQISVAAGVTAKDKRIKDAKNLIWQSGSGGHNRKKMFGNESSSVFMDEIITDKSREKKYFRCDQLPYAALAHNVKLSQLLYQLNTQVIQLTVIQSKDVNNVSELPPDSCQVSSMLHVFSSLGGLAILAQHLPLIYSETIRPIPNVSTAASNSNSVDAPDADWVKVDGSDDIPDDLEDYVPRGPTTPTRNSNTIPNVPPHSLAAFALFLRLPGYAEMLLRDYKKAQCLLRLVLGVTDDGEGGDIFQLPIAHSLPTLPFQVLRRLYDAIPITTDDSQLLRRTSINCGVIHLLLGCLSVFTHQSQDFRLPGCVQNDVMNVTSKSNNNGNNKSPTKNDDKAHLYWAKGTGFGTGSTQQSWNVEQALLKQRSEEEHVTVLLQVLSSYINPAGHSAAYADDEEDIENTIDTSDEQLPPVFYDLLQQSCLLPVICSYLRNDSVLDMARHIPLYRALLQLLRSIAMRRQLVSLLLPKSKSTSTTEDDSSKLCVVSLLTNMKLCVDTYASRLKLNVKSNSETGSPKAKFNKYFSSTGSGGEDSESDEGLALLIPDIQATADLVRKAAIQQGTYSNDSNEPNANKKSVPKLIIERSVIKSLELRYLEVMKRLQFDTFEMIRECTEAEGSGYQFVVSYHFEGNVKAAGDRSHPARVKRLAQEAVTLATSLPLSYSSSVFVRCDTDRLDVMKVLITGPADTPYANGCFELDVYFPPDYPQAPMMINLETTGRHTVRFNPNLYNDGKVCLSVLNTWHGRPEEKWNAQTSSFLQVLVSIQSLILVPEPYFNEPGYERSRGTPTGTQSSLEYNANIYQATVRWAMLEQIRNPCPCFKEVIHTHFWLKRHEIAAQIERWIAEIETLCPEKRTTGTRASSRRFPAVTALALKHHYIQLYEELARLKTPEGLEDLEELSTMENLKPSAVNSPIGAIKTSTPISETFPSFVFPVAESISASSATSSDVHHEIDTDIEMEKMVSKVCE